MEKLKTVSEAAYTGWFSKTTPLAIVDNTIKIGVPDDFFRDWLTEHYSDLLEDSLKACSYNLKFEFLEGYPAPAENAKIAESAPAKESDEVQGWLFADDPLFAEPTAPAAEKAEAKNEMTSTTEEAPAPKKVIGLNINMLNMHTFQNFLVGEENRYAYETIKSVALNPGAMYNPLYIYGGTGVGKTHLLQAVANEAISHNPSLSIRYTTCEELLNDFVELVKDHKNMYDFRTAMRNVDIFLVDDVHILGKSPRLQEEFFNTFNTLYNSRKQIILTSDKQPSDIEGLEDRLVSRFESGLTQEINAPEFETRLAILRAIRGDNSVKVKISDAVLEFIANNITSSVRRLKGAFIRVTAYANMHKDTIITIDHAEKLLANLITKEMVAKTVYIDDIQRAVAQHFNIKISDILGNARPKNIAEPRMAAMYLSRKLTGHSLPEIGSSFGKNHATVINAIKKVPELCEKSEEFKRSLQHIEHQLTRH
ncbi:MAG: chromosomal replication initiator protein DnaA [Lentisphaeria bacterium]|nr:chromosomal replication initiator protein DnaA [Lentisphaeria bacterium]